MADAIDILKLLKNKKLPDPGDSGIGKLMSDLKKIWAGETLPEKEMEALLQNIKKTEADELDFVARQKKKPPEEDIVNIFEEETGKYGVPYLIKLIKSKPNVRWTTYLGEKYDDFFESFGEIYKNLIKNKDLETFSNFKQSVGKHRFDKVVVKAKNEKKLTRKDTKKAEDAFRRVDRATEGNIARSWFMQNKGPEQVEATKIIVDAMTNNAPTMKRYNPATKKMQMVFDFREGSPFTYEKMLPKLKEQFPNLFENMNLNPKDKRNWLRYVRSKIKLPQNLRSRVAYEQDYLLDRFRNMYATEGNTKIDNQFIYDVWRSRPKEFRTKNSIQDVDMFFHFLDDVEYFNPLSENFYKTMDPDFSAYKKFREVQQTLPKGTHLSHKLHTVVPDPFFETRLGDDLVSVEKMKGKFETPNVYMSDAMPFSGADPVNLQFLPKHVNTKLQPLLEGKIFRELQKPIEKRNIKYLQDLEQQMIDAKITTRISDPIEGDDRIYGYVAETIDPITGFKDGGFVSIEEMLEYDHG
jgi:hypothetical protein